MSIAILAAATALVAQAAISGSTFCPGAHRVAQHSQLFWPGLPEDLHPDDLVLEVRAETGGPVYPQTFLVRRVHQGEFTGGSVTVSDARLTEFAAREAAATGKTPPDLITMRGHHEGPSAGEIGLIVGRAGKDQLERPVIYPRMARSIDKLRPLTGCPLRF